MGGPGSGRRPGGAKNPKVSKSKKPNSVFSSKAAEKRWNNRRTQTSKTRTK